MGIREPIVRVVAGLGGEWVSVGTHSFWFTDDLYRIRNAPVCSMHRFRDCYGSLSFSERHAIAHAGED